MEAARKKAEEILPARDVAGFAKEHGPIATLMAYVLAASAKTIIIKTLLFLVGRHPISALWFVSLGMALLAPVFCIRRKLGEKAEVETDWSSARVLSTLTVTSAIGWVQMIFSVTSLSLLPASAMVLFQLGIDLVATSIAVYFFRNRKHSAQRLAGIALIVIALAANAAMLLLMPAVKTATAACVGRTCAEQEPHPRARVAEGLVLLVVRACIGAPRSIMEERLLQEGNIAPSFVTAISGVFALVASSCIVPLYAAHSEVPQQMWLAVSGAISALADMTNEASAAPDFGLVLGRGFSATTEPLPQSGVHGFGTLHLFIATSTAATCLTASLVAVSSVDNILNKLGVKKAGALSKNVAKSSRPALVWLMSLSLNKLGGEHLNGVRSLGHACTLALQFFGMLLYAELVVRKAPKEPCTVSDVADPGARLAVLTETEQVISPRSL